MSEEKRMLEYMDKLGKDELKILESFSVFYGICATIQHCSTFNDLRDEIRYAAEGANYIFFDMHIMIIRSIMAKRDNFYGGVTLAGASMFAENYQKEVQHMMLSSMLSPVGLLFL